MNEALGQIIEEKKGDSGATGEYENKDIRVLQAKDKVEWDALQAGLPKAQLAFFLSSKILLYNLGTDNIHEEHMWSHITSPDGKGELTVGEHANLLQLNQAETPCSHSCMAVTGGLADETLKTSTHFLQFKKDDDGILYAGEDYKHNSELNLPKGRMMHQSCIVKNKDGNPMLLVFGGRVGTNLDDCDYSSSVIGLDLKEVVKGDAPASKWTDLKPMSTARTSFAHTVIDNKVYVFGGISAKQEVEINGSKIMAPVMSTPVSEVYDPVSDTWEEVKLEAFFNDRKIEGFGGLAAFGWTKIKSSLLIVGGSNGDLLTDSVWKVNFKNNTIKHEGEPMTDNIGMCGVIYNSEDKNTYIYGGINTAGRKFQRFGTGKFIEDKWRVNLFCDFSSFPYTYFE